MICVTVVYFLKTTEKQWYPHDGDAVAKHAYMGSLWKAITNNLYCHLGWMTR